MTLDFQPLKWGENKCLLLTPANLWYFVMAAYTNTPALDQGCGALIPHRVLTLLIVLSPRQVCSLPPLLPMLSLDCHTNPPRGKTRFGSSSLKVQAASMLYLVTVRSLAQSQHLLQGLGHHRLPLVQELLLTSTQVKAEAQVQVSRAASEGRGVGGVGDCSDEGSLNPAQFS